MGQILNFISRIPFRRTNTLRRAHAALPVTAVQNEYSMLWRGPEDVGYLSARNSASAAENAFHLMRAVGLSRVVKGDAMVKGVLMMFSMRHPNESRFALHYVLTGSAASSFILLVNSTSVILQSIGLAGDFNHNGVVDAADYVVWRKGLGTTYTQDDYSIWRSHFGQTAGSGSGATAAVPEPTTLVLLMFAAAGWCLRRDRAA